MKKNLGGVSGFFILGKTEILPYGRARSMPFNYIHTYIYIYIYIYTHTHTHIYVICVCIIED